MKAHQAKIVVESVERLSWAQIRKRYPDQWVVLVGADGKNDRDFAFNSALVVGHSKHRKDASSDVKAAFKRHKEVGCSGRVRSR